MKPSTIARCSPLTFALLAGVAAPAIVNAQPFTPTGIGNLNGGPSIAWGITSWAGPNFAVVGETDNNSVLGRACTFTTGMLAINSGSGPGGNFVPKIAYRINSAPSILIHVGSGSSAAIATRAFRTNGGSTFELGTLSPALHNSEARGVNVHGVVVGHCWAMNSYPGAGGNNSFAFQWVPTGGPSSNTGSMSMIPLHAAYDVNDSGIAVGQLNGLPYRLNIATNTLTNLGSFGWPLGSGVAHSINNAGFIVGNSPSGTTGLQNAFRSNGAGLSNIHPVPLIGSTSGASYAYDIQDGGGGNALVVGQFIGPNTGSGGHAFVYNPANGVFRDLNTWLPSGSGWVLEAAYGINDANCVVGRGRRNGQLEGFRMCIVPPVPAAPPCGGTGGGGNSSTLRIASATLPAGGTTQLVVDAAPVGGGAGMPVQIEWRYARRAALAGQADGDYRPLVDGPNADAGTGTIDFVAAIGTDGTLTISDPSPPSPGDQPISAGWLVTAIVRGPCDTLLSTAAALMPSPADVGVQGGGPGKDGSLDNNDFVSFVDGFFTAAPYADVGQQGGQLGPDGQHDNNDFVVYIDLFFGAD